MVDTARPRPPSVERVLQALRRLAPGVDASALLAVNVLIWGIISLSTWELIYFWPIWTAIPLVLAVIGTAASRRRH